MANGPRITDGEINKLLGLLAVQMRKEAVQSLLAGNDAQCFTTEQYRHAYGKRERGVFSKCEDRPDFCDKVVGNGWERLHLESLKGIVKEVKPDVWAAVEVL